jgi:hypothetical protein
MTTSDQIASPNLLSWFDDHIPFSEAHLKQTLEQVAECDPGGCDVFLRSLISPSNISRPVLELVLACKMTVVLYFFIDLTVFRSM